MKACPDRAAPVPPPDGRHGHSAAMRPPRPAFAPWRRCHANRPAGLLRAARTAAVCRLWCRLFPVTASAAVLADILANIAPCVLRRGGHGARRGRMPTAAAGRPDRGLAPGAPCGRVPVAARTGSGR
ncbi:hypothetical protein E7V67_013190 [[Empedobacter] haloabium]|uniref:Uncharacterized protein n=1 Tax=[Empedobacter] haloabium TaxID=592317 RepID=A0ABZ1UTC0_9BURK